MMIEASATVAASSVPTVDAATMAEVDRLAMEEYGITLLQMMEQAGSHLAEVVRVELDGELSGRRIVVAAGPGDNGGGGLAAARHLVNRGAQVQVVLATPALRLSEAARHQLATLLAMGTSCCVTVYDIDAAELAATLAEADLVVDALLGYRAVGPPRGAVADLLGFVARSGRPVVSLDVPTGLDPDTGVASTEVIRARATLTLALPKPGLLHGHGARLAGRLYLADIGLPASLYASMGIDVGPVFAPGRILHLLGEP